jgi:hypothetical protein
VPEQAVAAGNRLASIEDLLGHYNATPAPAPQAAPPPIGPPQAQVASITSRVAHPAVARPKGTASVKERYWVQLASGTNPAALPDEYRRITRRSPDYFEGLKGYVAETDGRLRLLIGPFKDRRDATDYASALEDDNIRAFSWVSPPGQPIRSLATR